jgi:GNAT superfamily N-acetyltransferase
MMREAVVLKEDMLIEKNIGVGTENRIDIRIIGTSQARELRALVLRPDQTPEMTAIVGDNDVDTLHLGAFKEDQLLGIATILHRAPHEFAGDQADKLWLLRGMATLPDVRGQGYGAALVRAGCGYVAGEQGIYLWCEARETALGFYEKMGFAIRGNRFDLPFTGPHYRMWRKVTATDEVNSPIRK